MPSTLSQLVLPVKNTTTGEVSNETFNLPGGGGSSYTELTTSIEANATTATFTDAAISDSKTFDIYTSIFTSVTNMTVSSTTLTVTLKPVSSAMNVKVRIS